MKNLKKLSTVVTTSIILAACGSAINGSYTLQQQGGMTQYSNYSSGYTNGYTSGYGNNSNCGTVNLTITQSGNTVNGSGGNSCFTESLTGSSNGNTVTNAVITISPANSGNVAYNNGYTNTGYVDPNSYNNTGYNTGNGPMYNYPGYGYTQPQNTNYNGYNNQGYNNQYQNGAQSMSCVYLGSLSISGSGSGSSVTGTLNLQNSQYAGMCTPTLQITGQKN